MDVGEVLLLDEVLILRVLIIWVLLHLFAPLVLLLLFRAISSLLICGTICFVEAVLESVGNDLLHALLRALLRAILRVVRVVYTVRFC